MPCLLQCLFLNYLLQFGDPLRAQRLLSLLDARVVTCQLLLRFRGKSWGGDVVVLVTTLLLEGGQRRR